MGYFLFILLVSTLVIQNSVAPPVTKEKSENSENEIDSSEGLSDTQEYHRYLQEVIQALESDETFRSKLEKADEKDILTGKIANELEFVSHNVRSKLDELKRQELERLRHLAIKQYELSNGIDTDHLKIPEHLDHVNPHTFEIDDLKKLIAKTAKDLEEADKRRREEFKEYEMHKKFEQEEKMKNMTQEDKKKFEDELHDLEKKHKDHEPLHHPGSKKQLEEVWEKQDHMDQEFNPRTFFHLHDLDGNGVWDQVELKALFRKELDKLYAEGHPEDDLVERAEEMERMREHVVKEADLNRDGLISYDEFLAQSQKAEFEQDPGWEPLDQQQIYSEKEYEEYRRRQAKEIEQQIARQMSQEYPGHPQAGHPQFPAQHPNQVYQQGYGQPGAPYQHIPQQQYVNQHGQINQHGQFQQIPQGQFDSQHQFQQMPQQGQFQQMPPHQGQYQQMPPHQGQHQQMPPHQGQFVNQHPPQHQFDPNQVVPDPHSMNNIPQHQQQQVHYQPQQVHQQQQQVNHQQQQALHEQQQQQQHHQQQQQQQQQYHDQQFQQHQQQQQQHHPEQPHQQQQQQQHHPEQVQHQQQQQQQQQHHQEQPQHQQQQQQQQQHHQEQPQHQQQQQQQQQHHQEQPQHQQQQNQQHQQQQQYHQEQPQHQQQQVNQNHPETNQHNVNQNQHQVNQVLVDQNQQVNQHPVQHQNQHPEQNNNVNQVPQQVQHNQPLSNEIPHQAPHEQIASVNYGQAHQNHDPNNVIVS